MKSGLMEEIPLFVIHWKKPLQKFLINFNFWYAVLRSKMFLKVFFIKSGNQSIDWDSRGGKNGNVVKIEFNIRGKL